MRQFLFSMLLFMLVYPANAQTLNPTVTGENMLCPEGTGVVSTQVFDTYQWHRRYLGSSQTQSLPGQVFQQLVMDYHNFAASYVSVTVTQGGQTATSPEFFVDGYVFLPPFVIIDGTFSIGPEGEIVWCPGDSLSFELGMPYNTNITWYRNGQPIPGAVSNVLKVTQDGSYSVSAAPEVCPDYIQWLGVPLEVIYCTTGIGGKLVSGIRLVDKGDAVYLMQDGDALCDQRPYRIFDGMGRLLGAGLVDAGRIPVAGLPPGLLIIHTDGFPAFRFIKNR